jgi:hypothetical protein
LQNSSYYFFDDHYLHENPGRAAYILHEDWKLPTTSGSEPHTSGIPTKEVRPAMNGTGTTYLTFLEFSDSLNLTDLDVDGPCRIEGVRLPELSDYLKGALPDESWPLELKLIRSQLSPSSDGPDLTGAFERVARFPILRILGWMLHSTIGLGTIEEARGEFETMLNRLAGEGFVNDPSKSLVSVGEHIAQLCLSVGWESEMYHQWIIFDDLWAGEHSDLADGILRYANRWDVLTA